MESFLKLFATVVVLYEISSYCGEWNFALGATIHDEPVLCVNSKDCKRSIYETKEPGREALLSSNFSRELYNVAFEEQQLTNNSRTPPTSFWDELDAHLFWNKIIYLTDARVNNDPERKQIPLCKIKNEEDYLYDCNKVTSIKFVCIGTKEGKIEECDRFGKTEDHFPLCKERYSNKVITCGRNTSAAWCFPTNGKKSHLHPCGREKRHICLLGSGLLEECQNLMNASETKVKENSFKGSPKGKNARVRKESVLNSDQEIQNLCLEGSDNKLQPCSKNPPSGPACFDPFNGKIELCENLEKFPEIGVSICIQSSTSRLLTCEKYGQTNLCYPSRRKRSAVKPCSITSKMICVSKNDSLTKCSQILTANNDIQQGKDKFKDIDHTVAINGRKKRQSEDVNMSKEWNSFFSRKYDNLTYLCTLGKQQKEIVYCETNISTYACLGAESGRISGCNTLRHTEISIPVCVVDSTYALVTCGKFNSVNLCKADSGKPIFRVCKSETQHACFKNGSIQYCAQNILISRSVDMKLSEEYVISNGPSSQNKVFSRAEKRSITKEVKNIMKLCISNVAEAKFQPCKEDFSKKEACFGFQNNAIEACDIFGKYELVFPVCLQDGKIRKVLTCGKISESPLCFPATGKYLLEICDAEERQVCLGSEGDLVKCHAISHLSNNKEKASKENGLNDDAKAENKEVKEAGKGENVTVNTRKLCIRNTKETKLQPCVESSNPKEACFGFQNSSIEACESFGKYELVSRLCLQDEKKRNVLTCGTHTNAPICFSPTGKFPLETCDEEERQVCLGPEGDLVKCRVVTYRSNNEEKTSKENGLNNDTQVESKEDAEAEKVETFTNNTKKLCIRNTEEAKFHPCVESLTSKIACFGYLNRSIEACDSFGKLELAFPLCLQDGKTRNVLTCGTYTKASICFSPTDKSSLEFCDEEEQQGCLGAEGDLVKCNNNNETFKENGVNGDAENISEKPTESKNGENSTKLPTLSPSEIANWQRDTESDTYDNEHFNESTYWTSQSVSSPLFDKEENGTESGIIRRNVSTPRTLGDYTGDFREALKKIVADIENKLWILCKPENDSEKLIICHNDSEKNFACIDANDGKIDRCKSDETIDVTLHICSEKISPHKVVKCDPAINAPQLCIKSTEGKQFLLPCEDEDIFACFEKDGNIINCNGLEKELLGEGLDEKFIRVQCENCSIDNTFRVVGEHPEILPEYEEIVFQVK